MKIKKEILVQLGIQEGSGSKDGVECSSTGDANSEELAMVETAHREEEVKKKCCIYGLGFSLLLKKEVC